MRSLALALFGLALACGSGSRDEPVIDTPAPARPQTFVCLTSERDPVHWMVEVSRLTEAVLDERVWTARVTGQAVSAPPPAPFQCGGFTPSGRIAFDDESGKRWWLEFAIVENGVDVTPAIAPATGSVTATFKQEDSFAAFRSIAISDEVGLVVALNGGSLLLAPTESGGVSATTGERVGPVYEGVCGLTQERLVTFAGEGASAALQPGHDGTVQVGSGPVNVWNLSTYDWITGNCTDLVNYESTFAWRPRG